MRVRIIKALLSIKAMLWLFSIVLSLLSRFVFMNDNKMVWQAANCINLLGFLFPITLMVCIFVLICKEPLLKKIPIIIIVPLVDITTIIIWISCTGCV